MPWRALRLLWILAPLMGNSRRFRAWKLGCFWMSPGLTIRNQLIATLHCSVIQISYRSRETARAVWWWQEVWTEPTPGTWRQIPGNKGNRLARSCVLPFHGTHVSSHRATGLGTTHLFNACSPCSSSQKRPLLVTEMQRIILAEQDFLTLNKSGVHYTLGLKLAQCGRKQPPRKFWILFPRFMYNINTAFFSYGNTWSSTP